MTIRKQLSTFAKCISDIEGFRFEITKLVSLSNFQCTVRGDFGV